MDAIAEWPFPIAVAALFAIVLVRAGATYAIGRAAHEGVLRSRWRKRLASTKFARAQQLIAKWGAPVVTASFLTIGFQTVANFAAGVLRMPLRRYVPALVVGGLLWAVLYAAIGVVSLAAIGQLFDRQPVLTLVLVGALIAGAAAFVFLRRSQRRKRVQLED